MTTETFTTFFVWLALACNAASVVLVVAMVAAPRHAGARDLVEGVGESALVLAGLVALVATAGSLYYSEVAHFVPCRYCWFQRIFMYPLAVMLPVAAWRRDQSVRWYALPLAVVGAGFAGYHYLLQHFPSLAGAGTCDVAAPCTAAWVWRYDFVSIPYMAGSGFVFIAVLLAAAARADRLTAARDDLAGDQNSDDEHPDDEHSDEPVESPA